VIFPLGRRYRRPVDALGRRIARLLLEPGAARERLVRGCYYNDDPADAVGRLEHAFRLVVEAEAIEQRIRHAVKNGELTLRPNENRLQAARDAGIIDEEQFATVARAAQAARDAIEVDDFDPAELLRRGLNPGESHAE
jgi:acyl-CoA dehydrogenase